VASDREIEIAAKAMQSSKAWPAVFQSGAARILAKAALDAVDKSRRDESKMADNIYGT